MATLRVRVQPRASRNSVESFEDGVLCLRVTAPPENGRANAAVTDLLARYLDIPRGRIRIIRGAASRNKVLEVTGIDSPRLKELLTDLTRQGRE